MSKQLHSLVAATSLALALTLAGCGGGSSAPAATTLSGTAMAGPFLSGQACAYKVVGGAKDALLGTCANLASSAFSIDIGSYTGDVLIEVGAGATYDDEANPNDNVTGTTLTGTMRTLINVGTTGGSVNLAVTPLTETALRLAGTTLNNTTVQAALTQIAALLPTVANLDLRTTLPASTTDLGLAYQQMLRALSQMQWVAGGNAAYTGGLNDYLTYLAGQIGTTGNTIGSDLLSQIGSGLSSNCSVTGGALSCTVATGGGGGGGGGTGGLTCNTAHYVAGAVHLPTNTELASFAQTYTGNTGSFDMTGFTSSGSATLVFSSSGGLTYNGTVQTVNSVCADNGAAMLYVEFGSTGAVDLFSANGGGFSGSLPDFTGICGNAPGCPTGSGGGGTTPTVTGFSPSSGAVGTSVSITGTNLGSLIPAPLVKFGTTNAGGPYTNVTSTNVTFTVPTGLAAGTHTITISNFDGTNAITVGTFTVTASGGGSTATGLTLSPAFNGLSSFANSVPNFSGTTLSYSQGFFQHVTVSYSVLAQASGAEQIVVSIMADLSGVDGYINQGSGFTVPACILTAVSGFSAPVCSSVGITFDKAAGSVSFVNTPMKAGFTGSTTAFTLNGSLSFTPF